MSLWTCIACTARRAVGLLTCPQCGAAEHEQGDTISGAQGVQGAAHVPEAYEQPIVTPAPAPAPVAAPVVPAPTAPPAEPADTPPAQE
jgi:hypothetical protein